MTDQPEASTSYRPPSKYILSPAHLAAFRRSATHEEITGFISDLNFSIVGKTLKDVQSSEVSWSQVTVLMEANTTSHRYPRHCIADCKGYPTSRQQAIPLR
jgi:serine/threonine-protein phosphatase 2A activator